jgi:coenzyme F420-reducing hydrogenase alpha subunit
MQEAKDMKNKDLHIKVHEVTRVEGHGNIVIDLRRGKVKDIWLQITEPPRFFEAMLVGRRYDEAQHIMSRICGICAVSHTCASLKAIESAMGIRISPQATLLRKLAFSAEIIQSHILHLFFLVLPDFFGVGSIVPLMQSNPEAAKDGLELKKTANEICSVIAGRHVHPISLFPGGVAHLPKESELKRLKSSLLSGFERLDRTLALFHKFPLPDFEKPREFVALKSRGEYGVYDGRPYSSRGYSIEANAYTKKIKEYIVSHSTAKHARTSRGSFMVGALARLNNNFTQLGPRAKKAAQALGLRPPFLNPFQNNLAQLVECYQMAEDAVSIIDALLKKGLREEPLARPRAYGLGIGIVEAPRGTLYHEYRINKDGCIEKAVCIIPTAQNLRSIEDDLRHFVQMGLDKPKDEIRKSIETLVRAYDPCISCSTHFMKVRFV